MVVGSKTRNFDNAYAWDITICTSGTRPTAYDGRPIYETDTDKFLIYNGSSWEEVGGGAGWDGSTDLIPDTDSARDLGAPSYYFALGYIDQLHFLAGTYIKDLSGDMELHVATGKKVKIVVG